jgi:hypothetical protein
MLNLKIQTKEMLIHNKIYPIKTILPLKQLILSIKTIIKIKDNLYKIEIKLDQNLYNLIKDLLKPIMRVFISQIIRQI